MDVFKNNIGSDEIRGQRTKKNRVEGNFWALLLIKPMHITKNTGSLSHTQLHRNSLSDVMLLLTVIMLVILPVCANVSPGATSKTDTA